MKARSDHVKRGLRKAYASKVPNENLDVFCVSNTMYEKYARKGNAKLVGASEIPEVRRFCYKITAEARYREARHFLQSSVPSLLHSLGLWVSSHADHDKVEDSPGEDLYGTLQNALVGPKAQVYSSPPPTCT